MTQLAFYGFSFLLLSGAINVVFAKNPVHSVLSLIFVFFNAASLFIILGAEFIAMTLVIVYVGAVAVLFLFVVMMMNVAGDRQSNIFSASYFKRSLQSLWYLIKIAVVFSIVFISLTIIPAFADLYQQGSLESLSMHDSLLLLMQSKWCVLNIYSLKGPAIVTTFIAVVLGFIISQKIVRKPYYNAVIGFFDSFVFFIILGLVFTIYFVMLGASWYVMPSAKDVINSPVPPLDLMTNTQALGQVLYVDYILAFQCAGVILLVGMIGAIALTLRTHQKSKRQNIYAQMSRNPKDTIELKKIPLGSGLSL